MSDEKESRQLVLEIGLYNPFRETPGWRPTYFTGQHYDSALEWIYRWRTLMGFGIRLTWYLAVPDSLDNHPEVEI